MSEYVVVILITLVGFLALAALLLIPVYRFLKREERRSEAWTDEQIAEKHRSSTNGSSPS